MKADAPAEPVGIALHAMAILEDLATIDLMERVVASSFPRDHLSVCTDLAEGLARAAAESPDVVFIDVNMGRSAGLAVVHHLRAIVQDVAIYALTQAATLQLGTQAVALGGTGLLMLPLSGDEFLTVLADVRARRVEREQRAKLERQALRSQQGATLVGRVAEIAEASTRREAAERLSDVLLSDAGAARVLVYLPAGEGIRQMIRVASRGDALDAPYFSDELELMTYAREAGLEVVRLAVRQEGYGLILLGGLPHVPDGEEPVPLVALVAAQAATAFALIGAREQSNRGAMKDPSSSAYTFAYFVDVAGRELGRARRHGRRFSLVTLGIEDSENGADADARSVEVVERVLGAVRATDMLARVDVGELYLLLPETGGIGAHVLRRRLLSALASGRGVNGSAAIATNIGVATYPHNGTDLSQLLRVAKHRAEASRGSAVRRLGLERLGLGEVLDAVLWDLADKPCPGPEQPQSIELPAIDVLSLATCAVAEARRAGNAQLKATMRTGVSVGAGLRSALAREGPDIKLELIDVAQAHDCRDLDVMTVISEQGCYALLGRAERGYVRAIHAADPTLVDLLNARLCEIAGGHP